MNWMMVTSVSLPNISKWYLRVTLSSKVTDHLRNIAFSHFSWQFYLKHFQNNPTRMHTYTHTHTQNHVMSASQSWTSCPQVLNHITIPLIMHYKCMPSTGENNTNQFLFFFLNVNWVCSPILYIFKLLGNSYVS